MSDELDRPMLLQWARTLYVDLGTDTNDIALQLGVSRATVEHWVRSEHWIALSTSLLTSRAAQLDYLYKLLANLQKKTPEEITPKDADLMLKYSATIANLELDISVSQIIEVADSFMRWLRRRDLKLARLLLPHLDTFIKERAKNQ